MNLTLEFAQAHISAKIKNNPTLGKLFHQIFGVINAGDFASVLNFKKLVNQIPLPAQAKILDLGTGDGAYAMSLAHDQPKSRVYALDIDSRRILSLRMTLEKYGITNVSTYCQKVETTLLSELDFVFAIDVFDDMLPEEMPFESVYQRMSSGGHFLVKIPNKSQRSVLPKAWFRKQNMNTDGEHLGKGYDLEGLKERFMAEGFELVHASYTDGYLSKLAWEISFFGKSKGAFAHLLIVPLAQALVMTDKLVHSGTWGNSLQVIGRKK
ncbi:MAG: class I SAM-dependent methyltransferase [Algoriphagus sp.]|nr:class I SAM-dependent methyltransferase [Algoriphagus sp.]